MQSQNLSELMSKSLNNPFAELSKQSMQPLADKNKMDIEKKKLPDPMRTPTADELVMMGIFARNYKRDNKKASRREIRNAVKKFFNIQVYK